jgi:hypothetical protein
MSTLLLVYFKKVIFSNMLKISQSKKNARKNVYMKIIKIIDRIKVTYINNY